MRPVHLVYFDESGNTGTNLSDPQQPVFVLGALLVPADKWLTIEAELLAALDLRFPPPRDDNFEVHAIKLLTGQKPFRVSGLPHCVAFQAEWLQVAQRHKLRFIYRRIVKRQFAEWTKKTFGTGVAINPHAMAFPLVARVVDEYLQKSADHPLGLFISDNNHEIAADLDKSLRLLRGIEGRLKLAHIIEKGFFIDSRHSLLLQLCDLCAYAARKKEELAIGHPVRDHHKSGIALIESLLHKGDEAFPDVIAWMTDQIKKRPGT
jgi:hypothetical protein